jgi:hypothetical protein
MDPSQTTAAVQPESHVDGDWRIYPDGTRLRRVRGGEISQPPAPAAGGEGGEGGDAPEGGDLGGLVDLSAVPEELRGYASEIAKQIQGNVTRRFQEHADFRRTWEPFSQIEGLTDVPADELQELLAFRNLVNDPGQFDNWFVQVGQALLEQEPDRFEQLFQRLGTETGMLEDDGEGGGDGESGGGDLVSQVSELLDQKLEERLGPIEQRFTSAEEQQRIDAAGQHIASELTRVGAQHQEQHGEELDDDAQDAIKQLAVAYGGAEDSIERGYQDYLRLTGKAQGELVDDKLGQPRPSVSGGSADTSPEALSFGDPRLKQAARERLRAAG